MLSQGTKDVILGLIRLGVGITEADQVNIPNKFDWDALQALANEQGLSAIVVDGLERIPAGLKPPKPVLQWIGEVSQGESVVAIQQKAAGEMALLFHHNHIRTYVLKGAVVAECYPNQMRRCSVDVDCFLLPENGEFDSWSLGNDLIREWGFEVDEGFYKNSTFIMPGVTVENHQFLTPFRGNKKLAALERVLQAMLRQDKGEDRFEGTWLYRPPVMVSALFLIEHAYSHFLHEGLTWRHILDWMMFSGKHINEINWSSFSACIDEFGFRKFFDAYMKLGYFLFGKLTEDELSKNEQRMLADVWAPLDIHESDQGLKGKIALAGNTWRARWKYRCFGDISMLHALWIQTKGVLLEKHPRLD